MFRIGIATVTPALFVTARRWEQNSYGTISGLEFGSPFLDFNEGDVDFFFRDPVNGAEHAARTGCIAPDDPMDQLAQTDDIVFFEALRE